MARRRATGLRARMTAASQSLMAAFHWIGARLMASVPPASTRCARPCAMRSRALASACSPEAQLRCTVKAGTALPQPRRRLMMRAMFASSGAGITQPTMTSSICWGANGARARTGRAAATARSAALNSLARPRAFRNGVRAPSTTNTFSSDMRVSSISRSCAAASCHTGARGLLHRLGDTSGTE